MVDPSDQDLQVILIVAEADLVSDFQQQFTPRGMTVRFAEDPTGAREATASVRPRLVVIPVEGACVPLLESWAEGESPADAVLGLLTPPANASAAPKSVSRTARRGRPQEILSLAELMLRRPAPKKPAASKEPPKPEPPEPEPPKPEPPKLTPPKLTPPPASKAMLTPPPASKAKLTPPPASKAKLTPPPVSKPTPPPPAPEPPKPEPPKATPTPPPPQPGATEEPDKPPEPDKAEEPSQTEDEPGSGDSIWDRPGGILKNIDLKRLAEEQEDAEEELDGPWEDDPSRVSDIRSLGVAVRMAKASKGDDSAPKAPAPVLRLSHGEDEPDLDGTKPAGITDAMALLPEAKAAETEEEARTRLAAERAAAEQHLSPTVRDPTALPFLAQPQVTVRKKRRWPLLLVVVLLVLGGGGGALYYLVLRPKPRSTKKVVVAKKPKAPRAKRGLHEDHFAGTIAQLPKTVTSLDVDVSDEFLNRSVPELNPYMEQALRRMSVNKRYKTLLEQGRKLLKWERYPEARRMLGRAVALRDRAEARAALARAYSGLGRHWAAIRHVRHAVKRKPKNAEYRVQLGLAYIREDRKKQGCRSLKRAARLDKAHAKVLEENCGKRRRRRRRRRRKRRRR